jgi:phospholipid/cholesterol/gamma-HCH transport system substrate-binding protein
MDLHYKQEATVGGLVLAGVAVFVLGTMWLSGRSLNASDQRVRARFTNVGNMKRGNPVKVSGVEMGRVEEIEFAGVGDVIVTMSLRQRVVPRADASVELASVGLVGDVFLDFSPGGAAEPLAADAVIIGTEERGLATLGTELGDQAKDVLTGLKEVANQRLADDLHNTLVSIQRLSETFASRREGPTAELEATMVSLQQLSRRIDSTLASPALDRTLTNLDTITVKLGRMTDQYTATGARLDSILASIDRGEGTIGRLVADSTVYVQLRDLTASIKAFVDDLRKHPGKITVQVKVF